MCNLQRFRVFNTLYDTVLHCKSQLMFLKITITIITITITIITIIFIEDDENNEFYPLMSTLLQKC